jgi:hypothetical protein
MDDLGEFGDALLQAEAGAREALHAQHTTPRLGPAPNFVGLVGEAEFSRQFGVAVDLSRQIGGDRGVDFTVPLRFTVDVKTARNPVFLICEEGKVVANVYVLAAYNEADHSAELLGWEWGPVLARAPVRDFGYGIRNHYIERAALKPISDLKSRVMRLT